MSDDVWGKVTQVHLEPTQKCQARCPMCDRNENGGKTNKYLTNADLSLEDIKKIMPIPFVKQLKNLYMCGNHGDPILADECLEILQWLRKINPKIHLSIVTNGGARDKKFWIEMAKVVNKVTFSVDGLADTNHLYRQGVSWKNVEANMKTYSKAGGKAEWHFLIFAYNEHQVVAAQWHAAQLRFKFVIKKSGRYLSTNTLKLRPEHQAVDRHGNETQLLAFPKDPKYQNKSKGDYDTVTDKFGSMDNYLEVAEIQPKCIKKEEIYISAEGLVLPCCWTAGQMYKWWMKPQQAQIWEHINKFDINGKTNSIKDIRKTFFKSISDSWEVGPNRLKVCALKCNKKFDPFEAQWK
jgi:MoaA/NifB/PqqE/SkfB family radical SAM enzyme